MKLLAEGIGACTPNYWQRLIVRGREAYWRTHTKPQMINPRSMNLTEVAKHYFLSVDPYNQEEAEACGISLKGEMTLEEVNKIYEETGLLFIEDNLTNKEYGR